MRASLAGRIVAQHRPQVAGDGAFVHRPHDLAVLDPEAAGAAGIVAGGRIDRGADQRGHQQSGAHLGEKRRARHSALRQREVPRGRARRRRGAAHRVAGAGQPELPRGGEIERPAGQHAVLDQHAPGDRQPLAVERPRAADPRPQRILDEIDPGRQHPLAQRVLEPARAARDRAAVDRLHQVPDQPGGDPLVVEHRKGPGRRLAGAGPRRGALAGEPADLRRVRQVGPVHPALEGIVALHRGAFAADRHRLDRMPGPAEPPEKPLVAAKCIRPADQLAPAASILLTPGTASAAASASSAAACSSAARRQRRAVLQIERRRVPVARQLAGLGEPAPAVLRRLARHRHRALGHRGDRRGADVARRDAGLLPADQHPEPEVDPLGALGLLQRAVADLDRQAVARDRDRVRRLGARRLRRREQLPGQRLEICRHLRSSP